MTQNNAIKKKPFIIGITGSIGTGKSEVSRYLMSLGYPVIDADQIARQVVMPGEIGLHHIVESFGEGVLNFDRSLNRRKLAEIIFNNDILRDRLNNILHPIIKMRIRDEINQFTSEAIIFVDVPLLFETDSKANYDEVLLVYASEAITLKRIMARDQISEDLALKKIRAQMPIDLKRSMSDYVISNDRDLEALHKQIAFYLKFVIERLHS
ncbi:MAG TPA: dephospho-CoA kinase [Clostridiales bacterium UBA8960]|jgi:dephospho-CoA kinase|nr:dephospho-CoA kinase [Clostridiales bacterium UBA8960]